MSEVRCGPEAISALEGLSATDRGQHFGQVSVVSMGIVHVVRSHRVDLESHRNLGEKIVA